MSFGWPLIPGVYVLANMLVFVYFALDRSWEALWSLLTIFAGGLAYRLFRRSRAS